MKEMYDPRIVHGFGTDYMKEIMGVMGLYSVFQKIGLSEPTPTILLLISLAKDGYFKGVSDEKLKDLSTLIESKDNYPLQKLYYQVSQDFYWIFGEDVGTFELKKIEDLTGKVFQEHFRDIFEYVLSYAFNRKTKKAGSFLLPSDLSSFLSELVDISSFNKIFNPFAGLVSFGLAASVDAQYLAQERNWYAIDCAVLRAAAHNRLKNDFFKIIPADSFIDWPMGQEFDLIISSPPFGVKLKEYNLEIQKYRTAENFLIKKGLKNLSANGQIVVLVSAGYLFREGEEGRTRRMLINEDLIEKVIMLPEGSLNGTSIPSAVLIINKNKKRPKEVCFVDISQVDPELLVGESKREVVRVILEGGNYPGVRWVPTNRVVLEDSILTPAIYLADQVEGIALSQVLKPYNGSKPSSRLHGRLTKIGHLSAASEDVKSIKAVGITEDEVATEEYKLPRNTTVVRESVLLVALTGKNLKPTYFAYDKLPLYISPGIKAFKVDTTLVDIDYLVGKLNSPQVAAQAEVYFQGSTLPRLRPIDFLKLRIPLPSQISLPSLDEQRRMAKELQEVDKQIALLKQEKADLITGQRRDRTIRFATLKHALGRPQQSILSAAKTIKGYLERIGEDGAKLNRDYAEFFEQERNVSDTLQGIINDVDFISRLMDRGENGLQVAKYPRDPHTLTAITDFLKGLTADGCKFQIELKAELEDSWKQLTLRINLNLLKVLMDNLFTNADKHGFSEDSPHNLVKISLSVIEYDFVMEVQNNGIPFPRKFGKEQYIQEFVTSHDERGQGIGGHQVNEIATYFENEDWELICEETAVFPVTFIFKFPVDEDIITL